MSRRIPILLLLTILVVGTLSVASGVYLDKTIWLPDSLGGEHRFVSAVYHPGNNTVYCLSEFWSFLLAIDAATHRKVARVPLPKDPWRVCLDTTANRLYCGSDGEGVTVIDCQTNTVVRQVDEVRAGAGITFSPVSNRVYCASDVDSTLTVLDRGSYEVVDRLVVGYVATGMAYNRTNDKLYVTAEDGWGRSVSIIDCSSGSAEFLGPDSLVGAYGPVWDPVGNRLLCFVVTWEHCYAAAIDGTTDSLLVLIRLPIEIDDPSCTCLNPVNRKLYCPNDEGVLAVFDAETMRPLSYLQLGEEAVSLALNTRANEVYCGIDAGDDTFNILVVDGEANTAIAWLGAPDAPVGLCYVPQQNEVYCASDYVGAVSVLDCAARKTADIIRTGVWPDTVLYNPATRKLYVLDGEQDLLTVIDAIGDVVAATVPVRGSQDMLACDTRQGQVYCPVNSGRSLVVIDGHGDSVRASIEIPGSVKELTYVRPHDKLYVACGDSSIAVVSCSSETVVASMPFGRSVRELRYDSTSDLVFAFLTSRHIYDLAAIDPGGDSVLWTRDVGSWSTGSLYNPTSRRFYSCVDEELAVLDPFSDSVPLCVPLPWRGSRLCLNPVENKLYILAFGRVYVFDCSSDSVIATVMLPFQYPHSYCFNPTNNRFLVGDYAEGIVVAIDGRTDSICWSSTEATWPLGITCDPAASRYYVTGVLGVSVFQDSLGRAVSGTGLTSRVLVGPTLVLEGRPGVMYDMTGRKVKALSRGQNDIREISSGVYVIRQEANGDTPGAVHKVVIQK